MNGHAINYLDEADLRTGIPHSEKIEQFPAAPFVGELGYANILARILDLTNQELLGQFTATVTCSMIKQTYARN